MKLLKKIQILCWILLLSSLTNSISSYAQGQVRDYMDKAGLFSRLYSGEVTSRYNPQIYQGSPYFNGENYTIGTIVFNNVEYPELNILLDLYKQQVIIINPNNYAIIVPNEKIQKVILNDNVFMWRNSTPENGLKYSGFYIHYFTGKNVELVCDERYVIREEKIIPITFEQKERFYLKKGDFYYKISGKGDFLKIFPEAKKQINEYAKSQRLDFSTRKIQSMISLASMCDKL